MNTITLYRTPRGWVADFSAADDADTMREIVGTDQIPTPYTAQAEPARVLAAVQARNPRSTVVLR